MSQLNIQHCKTEIYRPYGTLANLYLNFYQHVVPGGTVPDDKMDFSQSLFTYFSYFVYNSTVPEGLNIGRKFNQQ